MVNFLASLENFHLNKNNSSGKFSSTFFKRWTKTFPLFELQVSDIVGENVRHVFTRLFRHM